MGAHLSIFLSHPSPQPSVFPSGCFSPFLVEALCQQPSDFMGCYLWAGWYHSMPCVTQNIMVFSLSAPAQTMRNPPGQQPASWATCGNTPSSTGTSRWYVPPSGVGAWGRAQGSHGWGLHLGNVRHPNASGHMTCPDSTPSLHVEVGMSPEHHPSGARCLKGWEHPWAQGGHSMPGKSMFAFPVPTSWQGVATGVLEQG